MKTQTKAFAMISATLCLFAICFVVTFAVAGTRYAFKDRIAEQEWLEKQEIMSRLLKADTYEEVPVGDDNQAYQALDKEGKLSGYLFVTAAYGYGSDVSVMTGIANGKVVGIDILDCANETPGLGQNVAQSSFKRQFAGLTETPVVTKTAAETANEIQAVTGATKTSNAVASAVDQALVLYDSLTEGGK